MVDKLCFKLVGGYFIPSLLPSPLDRNLAKMPSGAITGLGNPANLARIGGGFQRFPCGHWWQVALVFMGLRAGNQQLVGACALCSLRVPSRQGCGREGHWSAFT